MKKRLWGIFGPFFIACGLLALLFGFPYANLPVSNFNLQRGATALTKSIFAGQRVKTAAMKKKEYIPFIGSSEFSRIDSFHPSVMASKYDRNYTPFLLGEPGTQSLAQYLNLVSMGNSLDGKKAVVIVSPQWFTKDGISLPYFAHDYSPNQLTTWLKKDDLNEMDKYAAKRMLTLNDQSSHEANAIFNQSEIGLLKDVANGQKLSQTQQRDLTISNYWQKQLDAVFTNFYYSPNQAKIAQAQKALPNDPTQAKLQALATKEGQDSTHNFLQISDQAYHDLKPHLKRIRNHQRTLSYVQSPEYSDFELMLAFFKQHHMPVTFVIPPVNGRWMQFTGLSTQMMNTFDQKINYQLRSQGFDNIIDLTQDRNVPYFMTDTIHLGWRGWLTIDERLKPFLTQPQPKPNYQIDSKFLSKDWQKQRSNF